MRPGVQRQRACTADAPAGGADAHIGRWHVDILVRIQRVRQLTRDFLHHDRAPHAARGRGIDPGLEGHGGSQAQRGGIRNVDHAARAIERQRLAVLAGSGPGRVGKRAFVVIARSVVGRGPSAFLEAVGRNQTGRLRVRRRAGEAEREDEGDELEEVEAGRGGFGSGIQDGALTISLSVSRRQEGRCANAIRTAVQRTTPPNPCTDLPRPFVFCDLIHKANQALAHEESANVVQDFEWPVYFK